MGEYKGTLKSIDPYMNLQLLNTAEWARKSLTWIEAFGSARLGRNTFLPVSQTGSFDDGALRLKAGYITRTAQSNCWVAVESLCASCHWRSNDCTHVIETKK